VAEFLRARAWWRLDSAGASAIRVARSVVALIDAAGYLLSLPDDDPDLAALAAAGCFAGGVFDPGPEGWTIVREWQLADENSAGPEDLLAQLAWAAMCDGPRRHRADRDRRYPHGPVPAALGVPRQPGPWLRPDPAGWAGNGTRPAPPITAS
jgi:hypothetical protein